MSTRRTRVRKLLASTLAVAASLAWVSCDPIADERYAGEPLLQISGVVVDFSAGEGSHSISGELRLAVLWARTGEVYEDLDALEAVEQEAVLTGQFPARFEFSLYAPPPAGVVGTAQKLGLPALGVLAVYVDTDDDDRWTSADRIVGGATSWLVHYEDGEYAVAELEPCLGEEHVTDGDDGTLEIAIDAERPTSLLPDLDCDDDHEEWYLDECPGEARLEQLCPGVCEGTYEGDCELDYCCDVFHDYEYDDYDGYDGYDYDEVMEEVWEGFESMW